MYTSGDTLPRTDYSTTVSVPWSLFSGKALQLTGVASLFVPHTGEEIRKQVSRGRQLNIPGTPPTTRMSIDSTA
ncbi:hypothetical protein E2C01_038782 [Portunus trituberculatus]|uniref:Uncharacterized protein n=1 Tax=Portunus trituberculatus TaxID=210409 RepID=A0A5B7FHU8_PORTR|nr:hypothetical protein [Portunus trituberculatus]